ncbi:Imm5 family immunity protein [Pseudobacteroides cellulosolvens]|uniref:Immunity protein Imm5 n=1 Tax=Pseudobacteroides cellulosolvens ATCC 35603 = DSM 2933 TaxID=398512 RepID=A0A0L6JME7_9FIRM|nr:Imm5 family immunity protein [Pseudobacteroides cellulosolvens]KNY26562.1 Immunity protein Imm5 [Pseudobacteroides cellulosolvens ATCC 35603 = DSM 2933]
MNNKLNLEINKAKEALQNEPNGRLILSYRKKIWSAFGPCEMDEEKAIITKPLIKRLKLAFLCAEKVLPIWQEVYSDKYDALHILKYVKEYMDGLRSWERCYNMFNEFSARLTNLESGPLRPFAAGNCVSLVLGTALFDEEVDDEDEAYDKDDDEEDRDVDLWDASFAASVALSGLYWSDDDNDIEKRRDYWNWYLNEAVLIAAKA